MTGVEIVVVTSAVLTAAVAIVQLTDRFNKR